LGIGTLGLGFGVSVSNGIYEVAQAATEEEKHSLLIGRIFGMTFPAGAKGIHAVNVTVT
jgi:hypothetical protein